MRDVAELLDATVPHYHGSGDWSAVLRDARVAGVARRRRAPARVALAAAVVVAAVALGLLWPFGGASPTVLERALAATGEGGVLHVVFESALPKTAVDLDTGERTEVYGRREVWFDPAAGWRERETFDGVVQFDVSTDATGINDHAREIYTSLGAGYREALESGRARVVDEGVVEGVPVYWIRIAEGHDVAVSRETYIPVEFRVGGELAPPGEEAVTRILTYETLESGKAPLESAAPAREPDGVGRVGDPVTLAGARAVLGRDPVWAGAGLDGLRLTSVRRLTLPTEGGAVDGVSLMYGSTSDGGRHVEIMQSARRADGLTMLVGLRRYAPAPGTLLLQGTSGLLR